MYKYGNLYCLQIKHKQLRTLLTSHQLTRKVDMKLLVVFVLLLVDCRVMTQACEEGDIRMTGGQFTMSRGTYYLAGGLQMCVVHKWATICQSQWDNDDATVACSQLGLNYTGSKLSYPYKLIQRSLLLNRVIAAQDSAKRYKIFFSIIYYSPNFI